MAKKKFLLFFLLNTYSFVNAQRILNVHSSFVMNEKDNYWEILEDKENILKINEARQSKNWRNIASFPLTFSSEIKAVWLKIVLKNSSLSSLPIRVFTKGIDNLQVSWLDNFGKVNTSITGKNTPLTKRFMTSQFLITPINLYPNSVTTVLVRIENQSYPLSLPYLNIANPTQTHQFVKIGEMFYNIYLGGILLMILFSIILFIFFKERLYLFYFFCLIGSFLMASVYNDYHYLVLEKVPEFIKNKNIFAVITTLLNCNYVLFAEQYLKVDVNKNDSVIKYNRIVMGVLFSLLCGMLIFEKELYHYRMFFYPLFALNVLTMNYYLLISIKRKYSPSWYFLIATTPIAIVSILEITSDYNNIPVQTMHDLYYAATFFEMFFLTIGIVFRFRMERTSLQTLEEEHSDITNKESARIARDLHDNIGASIVGIQMRLAAFQEKYFGENSSPEEFQKTLEYLEKTSKDVRSLSHDLTPKTLTDLGLVEQIKEDYEYISKPIFRLSLPEYELNIDSNVELALYKIIREGVQNSIKHAKATEVGIELTKEKTNIKLKIDDNGIGFDSSKIKKGGMGLNNMKIRAETQLKGSFSIESSPGNGTLITIKCNLKDIPKRKS
jgi:signal transduction histidine kinase